MARWNGTAWSALGTGLNNAVQVLAAPGRSPGGLAVAGAAAGGSVGKRGGAEIMPAAINPRAVGQAATAAVAVAR